jgi:hypothetical protein
MKYYIVQGGLGWKNPNGIMLRCVDSQEANDLMKDFHKEFCGGYYIAKTTMHMILTVGYYWPTIFHEIHRFIRSC